MSDQPPILPLPSIKSPRPFSFATDTYIPADPSRFTHFMPSPISSARPDLRRPSASPAGSTSYKRSYLEDDTASPEAGSSLEEDRLVKEEEDEEDDKTASGRALKQTKRAAQNRAAQQAFRKRKEERIRELENKEKLLNKYIEKERELVRREQELLEREQLSALRQLKAEASGSNVGYPETSQNALNLEAATILTRPAEFPHMQQQQQQQEEESHLRDARKMSLSLQLDLSEVKRQLEHKDSLLEALRRSLEDLGGENRSLRALINQQGGDAPPEAQ